jgi:tRNA threonylcarbamoyladenosine biosynthesis protein TsaE
MKKVFETKSAAATEKLGADLAATLQGGDVVALSGDLGGGKTTFTKGLARQLGVTKTVVSPTFLIERIFTIPPSIGAGKSAARLQALHHFDAYRLQSPADLQTLGWEELLTDKKNLVVVEWADKVASIMPAGTIWVRFSFVSDNIRKIEIDRPRQNYKNLL